MQPARRFSVSRMGTSGTYNGRYLNIQTCDFRPLSVQLRCRANISLKSEEHLERNPPLSQFRRTLKGGADFNDQLSRLCLLVFSAVNRYHKSCCSSHMGAGEPETACAYSFCWCLDRRTGDPKISRKASLRMCSACLVVFLVMGRPRVDKTNQYDLGNIRSTAPHFTDLELRSGDFIRGNESYPELISLSAVALPKLVLKDRELRI